MPRLACTAAPTGFITSEATRSEATAVRGLDLQDQHQDRGHQGAATHAGEAHDEADDQAGENEREVDVHVASASLTLPTNKLDNSPGRPARH